MTSFQGWCSVQGNISLTGYELARSIRVRQPSKKQNPHAAAEWRGNTMSKHHSELNGCELIDDTSSAYNDILKRYSRKTCLTHKLRVCHCGWEIRYHYGEDSRTLGKNEVNKARSIRLKAFWAKRKTAITNA